MKLIDKYLLKEYVVPLVYCFCGFCLLYIVAGLFDKISDFIKAGATLADIFKYYALYVVSYADKGNISFVVTILPVSLLAASLYTLSRLTRQNELMAMCASGVSMLRLMTPFLAVALLCSVVAFTVQEFVAPVAARHLDDMKLRMKGADPAVARMVSNLRYHNSEKRRRWEIAKFNPDSPRQLEGVLVKVEREDTAYELKITAERAEWRDGAWHFYGMSEQKFLTDNVQDGPGSEPNPGPVRMDMLEETPEDLLFAVEPAALDDSSMFERYSGSFKLAGYLASIDRRSNSGLAKKQVDANLRISMPWACLIAAMLAIPAGTKGGRQGILSGIILAVALFLGFYITMQIASFMGKKEYLAPWLSAWISHAVFFVTGCVMIAKMKY